MASPAAPPAVALPLVFALLPADTRLRCAEVCRAWRAALADLGTPEAAAADLLTQYLAEFASTRLGVRREAAVLSATPRAGGDGRDYLDIELNVKSFAAMQQYGVTAEARGPQALEWDRRLLTTLGVANGRLYQLRLQANEERLEDVRPAFRAIMDSFRVFDVAA